MTTYFIFKTHYSLTLYMVGIIWLVQIIHYPLFKFVNESNFVEYHKLHLKRTSIVIAIPMVLELLTAVTLIIFDAGYRNNFLFLSANLLLALIWITTFFISVPKHNILAKGFNPSAIHSLIQTNWIRTLAWTLRAALLFKLLK